ncbi:thioredoxin domain-containing protein [Roseovarius aestuarii]|uniref:Thioredoxin-like fold domain-containing protein n=1 Tax=Roseovarius aestuarii TaxID=475083 RepID=A0A1X7BXI2_9RHOB|nr:hypothetical protein ROA7745_04224 [Roseovarius aestuarii]
MIRLKALLIVAMSWLPFSSAAETYLLMAEEQGCYWCARWNEEISHIYPKTDEGKTAPLRRYDLHADDPGADLRSRVHYTPTFILVENGKEVGRIEGYPGEDFFWSLLNMMFKQANISFDQTG